MKIFGNSIAMICVLLVVFLIICSLIMAFGDNEPIRNNPEERFVRIQEWDDNFIMYDKQTRVQYIVFTGGIQVLLDKEGKPILYEGE